MNDEGTSPTRSVSGAANLDSHTPSMMKEGVPGATATEPGMDEAVIPSSAWTGRRITALVIGSLLVLISLGLLGAGGAGLWFDRTQRDQGYVTTDIHRFSSNGSALVTEPTDLGSSGIGWLYSPSLLDKVRIRVTPKNDDSVLFVGIGHSTDVEGYLDDVSHTLISDFWDDKVEAVGGGTPGTAPGTQDFWVASSTGAGAQTLLWNPTNGSWTVVVMNADGRPGIAVETDLGARMPALLWIAFGVLITGTVLLVGGALLITTAIRRHRARLASPTAVMNISEVPKQV